MKRIRALVAAAGMMFSLIGAVMPEGAGLTASAEETVTEGVLTFALYDTYAALKECNAEAEGTLVIPAEIHGLPVTQIRDCCFVDCDKLDEVIVPDSITWIGESAFDDFYCSRIYFGSESFTKGDEDFEFPVLGSKFKEVIFSTDNPLFTSMNGAVYNKDQTELIFLSHYYPNSSFEIPDGVTSIGIEAFAGCAGLTGITIPESVKRVRNAAFMDCSGLTSITIPKSVIDLGGEMFENCTALRSVMLSEGLKNIDFFAFSNCTSLTDVKIPNSVTSIGFGAFNNCIGLTEITIPGSVTYIGDGAFSNCIGLTDITLLEGVTHIGNNAFLGCTGLTSVTIPASVTELGVDIFGGCVNLSTFSVAEDNPSYCDINGIIYSKDGELLVLCPEGISGEVVIPDGVKDIGHNSFSGKTGLTGITIPDSVNSIGWSTFSGCTALKSVTISDSVTSIGRQAFEGCDNLTIKGYTGSYAEQYAKENGIPFVSLDELPVQTTTETTVTSETTTTAPQLLMGDFSGNGTRDMNDAVLLIRYITEDGSITAKTRKQLNPEAADLNGDGYLTMPDVRVLLCLLNAG